MSNRVIVVRPLPPPDPAQPGSPGYPSFEVILGGDFLDVLKAGKPVRLGIYALSAEEAAGGARHGGVCIGEIKGALHKVAGPEGYFDLDGARPEPVRKPANKQTPQAGFVFTQSGKPSPTPFGLPDNLTRHSPAPDSYLIQDHSWNIQLRVDELDLASPVFPVAWNRFAVPARFDDAPACAFDWHAGNTVHFYTDGSVDRDGTGGAFHDMRAAIDQAQHIVFIADWSFHPTAILKPSGNSVMQTAGAKLLQKAAQGVLVAIHTWQPLYPVADEVNTYGWDIFKKMAEELEDKKLLKSAAQALKNIVWRTSTRNVRLWSHHQKFVVTDCAGDGGRRDLRLFYGGLDQTKGRFDWPGHPILPNPANLAETAALRQALKEAGGDDPWVMKYTVDKRTFDNWYNAEFNGGGDTQGSLPDGEIYPRQPWHDIHASLDGPVAWDVARAFLKRWLQPAESNKKNVDDTAAGSRAWKAFHDVLMDRTKFVQQWETRRAPGPWSGQVLHSLSRLHAAAPRKNEKWHPRREEFRWTVQPAAGGDSDSERSIQNAYLRAIAKAERFIHIENQYFIGAGRHWSPALASIANEIPAALVERIKRKQKDGQPFHVYIVLPMMPEGDPADNAYRGIRHLEWNTIAWMVGELRGAGIANWNEYLTFYFLAKSTGAEGNALHWPASDSEENAGVQRIQLTRQNARYMIYVHSKLMIADDRYVILGSANINERSMAGDRDTEICVSLWPSSGARAGECEHVVQSQLRLPLLQEYLGGAAMPNVDQPESKAYRDALLTHARQNYAAIRGGMPCAGHLAAFPFDVDASTPTPAVASWAAKRPTREEARANPDIVREFEEHNRLLDALWAETPSINATGWTWEGVLSGMVSSGVGRQILE